MAPRNLVYAPLELTQDEGSTEEEEAPGLGDNPESPMASGMSLPSDASKLRPRSDHATRIVWRNVILMAVLHVNSLYAFLFLTWKCKPYTLIWTVVLTQFSGLGITAGAHRLWAHRCYKAKLPLRILLAIFNCMAFQNDIYEWSRDHRVHHKYTETDADPHNAKRGFFFSHVGWLLCRKHSQVIEKGSGIDLSDLLADPVVRYQKKFYLPLFVFFCFVVPTVVPMYFWEETFQNAFFVPALLRYCIVLNSTWMVNSVAHLWGNRPYDRFINPAENVVVSGFAMGEGWHNYHHTFPWDYKTGEFGWRINVTTMFIDMMACLGQVSDRKVVPKKVIQARKQRTGEVVSAVGSE